MSTGMTCKPELLAPAGSLEAFFAAFDGGADAVYLGLKTFSARAKAKNFSLSELEKLVAFAHSNRRRVYITLNTLIKERELPELVETLALLESLAVDAVILQDLAVWRLIRQYFPGLKMHASTQLTIHNPAGAQMLEQMGFTRVVLARELSLEEIAEIRAVTQLGLEHFIHGAHCFSLSGQCSFSSWLGGMSGNRGRCAQPCRRRYRHGGSDGYHFSPNDLSAVELLPELAEAGIESLKIEGRMKSAEYVSNVVRAYRLVLDADPTVLPAAIASAKEILKGSFGRLPTRGFLLGPAPTDMVNPGLHGATGKLLGRIEACMPGQMTFVTHDPLKRGDRLRVQPASDRPGTGFTLRELAVSRRQVVQVSKGTRVTVGIPPEVTFRKGDAVFKVATGDSTTASEAICRKRLTKAPPAQLGIKVSVSCPTADSLEVAAVGDGVVLTCRYPLTTFPAKERPLSSETLEKIFRQTGAALFRLIEFRSGLLPPVVVPPSELKTIRRTFYAELTSQIMAFRDQNRAEHTRQALAALLPASMPPIAVRVSHCIGIGAPRDLHLLRDSNVDEIALPLFPGALVRLEASARGNLRQVDRIIWDLPPAIFPGDWPAYQAEVDRLVGRGFWRFRLHNLGQFPLFANLTKVELEAGARLFSLNSQALLAWRELGCSRAVACLEDDRDNLADLFRRQTGILLSVTVYANPALMVSRIPLKMVKPERPLVSDRNESYRVVQRGGLTHVRPEQDFSLIGHLEELRNMGCRRFLVDLTHCGPFSPNGRKVLSALDKNQPLTSTSPFNYLLGMT